MVLRGKAGRGRTGSGGGWGGCRHGRWAGGDVGVRRDDRVGNTAVS